MLQPAPGAQPHLQLARAALEQRRYLVTRKRVPSRRTVRMAHLLVAIVAMQPGGQMAPRQVLIGACLGDDAKLNGSSIRRSHILSSTVHHAARDVVAGLVKVLPLALPLIAVKRCHQQAFDAGHRWNHPVFIGRCMSLPFTSIAGEFDPSVGYRPENLHGAYIIRTSRKRWRVSPRPPARCDIWTAAASCRSACCRPSRCAGWCRAWTVSSNAIATS